MAITSPQRDLGSLGNAASEVRHALEHAEGSSFCDQNIATIDYGFIFWIFLTFHKTSLRFCGHVLAREVIDNRILKSIQIHQQRDFSRILGGIQIEWFDQVLENCSYLYLISLTRVQNITLICIPCDVSYLYLLAHRALGKCNINTYQYSDTKYVSSSYLPAKITNYLFYLTIFSDYFPYMVL